MDVIPTVDVKRQYMYWAQKSTVSVMVMRMNSLQTQDGNTQQQVNAPSHIKRKQRRHMLKGPGDKIATEHIKVTGKTEQGVSRHKNNKVDDVH